MGWSCIPGRKKGGIRVKRSRLILTPESPQGITPTDVTTDFATSNADEWEADAGYESFGDERLYYTTESGDDDVKVNEIIGKLEKMKKTRGSTNEITDLTTSTSLNNNETNSTGSSSLELSITNTSQEMTTSNADLLDESGNSCCDGDSSDKDDPLYYTDNRPIDREKKVSVRPNKRNMGLRRTMLSPEEFDKTCPDLSKFDGCGAEMGEEEEPPSMTQSQKDKLDRSQHSYRNLGGLLYCTHDEIFMDFILVPLAQAKHFCAEFANEGDRKIENFHIAVKQIPRMKIVTGKGRVFTNGRWYRPLVLFQKGSYDDIAIVLNNYTLARRAVFVTWPELAYMGGRTDYDDTAIKLKLGIMNGEHRLCNIAGNWFSKDQLIEFCMQCEKKKCVKWVGEAEWVTVDLKIKGKKRGKKDYGGDQTRNNTSDSSSGGSGSGFGKSIKNSSGSEQIITTTDGTTNNLSPKVVGKTWMEVEQIIQELDLRPDFDETGHKNPNPRVYRRRSPSITGPPSGVTKDKIATEEDIRKMEEMTEDVFDREICALTALDTTANNNYTERKRSKKTSSYTISSSNYDTNYRMDKKSDRWLERPQKLKATKSAPKLSRQHHAITTDIVVRRRRTRIRTNDVNPENYNNMQLVPFTKSLRLKEGCPFK